LRILYSNVFYHDFDSSQPGNAEGATVHQEQRQIRLRDGRALAYAEYGDPDGIPIVYCHGLPSSRVEGRLVMGGDALAEPGVRVIMPDRPGIGESDFLANRRITDWPGDVLQLAQALEIDRFAVLGSSGGSPYALACGALLPERVAAVGVVGGLAPPDAPAIATRGTRALAWLTERCPVLVRGMLKLQLATLRSPKLRQGMTAAFPEPDRTLLQRPEIRDAFIGCFEEACRHGTRGAVWDMRLGAHAWGFELQRLRVPVLIWQGERDGNVSSAHGRYLASAIPDARATFFPDDAHVSIWLNHRRQIFRELQQAYAERRLRRA
jgi:pimeloyl-ACP methyl ester carboxylesterase